MTPWALTMEHVLYFRLVQVEEELWRGHVGAPPPPRPAPRWDPVALTSPGLPGRPRIPRPPHYGVTIRTGRETLERLVGDEGEPGLECKGSYSLQPNRREFPWLRMVLPSMAKVRRSRVK